MGFFSGCCKWLLFISNFLVFILSCVGLGLGIWILVDKSSFVDLLEQTDHTIHIYESTAVLILIVAVGSILISFFGCCGAFKESKCMIGTYFFILLALLILVLAGAVVAMSQGIEKLSDPFMDTLSRYQRGRHGTIETVWDDVQTQLQCCGVNSPKDWSDHNSGFQNGDNYELESGNKIIINVRVPDSCCAAASNKELCKVVPTSANGVFVEGCFTKVKEQISGHIEIVGGVSIAVMVIMVVNLFLSVYLCTCGLDKDDDERPRRKFYNKSRQTDRV